MLFNLTYREPAAEASSASNQTQTPTPTSSSAAAPFLLRQDDYLPYEQIEPTMPSFMFMRSELFYAHEAERDRNELLRSELYYPQQQQQQAEEEHALMRSEMHYPHEYPLAPLLLMRSELHYPYDKATDISRIPLVLVRSEQFYPQNAQDAHNELQILYLQSCAIKVQSFSRMICSRIAYLRAKNAATKLISIGRMFLAKQHVLALLANARNMAASAVTSTDVVLLDTTTQKNTIALTDLALVWSQFTQFTLRRALVHAADGQVFSDDIEALVMSFCRPTCLQSNLLPLPDAALVVRNRRRNNASYTTSTPPFSLTELFAFASIIYHMLKKDGRFEVKTWASWACSSSSFSSSKESNSLVLFASTSTTPSMPSRASFKKFCLWCFGTARSIEVFVERLQFLGISLSLNDDGLAASLALSRRRHQHRRNAGTNSLLQSIWILFASYQGPCNEDLPIIRYKKKMTRPNDFDNDKENDPCCADDDEVTFLG